MRWAARTRKKKGFALYRFPQGDKNRERRRVWEARTKRDKWKANDNSRLCEVHFEADQFEPLRKGPKKLKWTAVPTLFSHCAVKKKRKPPKKRECTVQVAVQANSSPPSPPANSVLMAASDQEWQHQRVSSSPANPPANSVLIAASDQERQHQRVDSNQVSSPADSVLEGASHEEWQPQHAHSSPASSPADSVLMVASDQDWPSNQAATCVATTSASSEQSGPCGVQEITSAANTSTACHENLLIVPQQISPRKKIADLQRKIKHLQKKNRDLVEVNTGIKEGIKKVFSKDQMRALAKKKNNGCPWSAETIKKALRLHFACGSTGYNLLISQGHPLPAERTLRERTQGVKFEPGVLHEVFEMMECKVAAFKEHERKCVLMIDEMQLHDKLEYDPSSQSVCGFTTLGERADEPVLATHCLAFMLGGVCTRWKQIVAYHFTGSSFKGTDCAAVVREIILKCSSVKLDVVAITSDMGAGNRALWRVLGVVAERNSAVSYSTPHPHQPSKNMCASGCPTHTEKHKKSPLQTADHNAARQHC